MGRIRILQVSVLLLENSENGEAGERKRLDKDRILGACVARRDVHLHDIRTGFSLNENLKLTFDINGMTRLP